MDWDRTRDATVYKVVIDALGQYSYLPVERDIPRGWIDVGKRGTRAECLRYIEEAGANKTL